MFPIIPISSYRTLEHIIRNLEKGSINALKWRILQPPELGTIIAIIGIQSKFKLSQGLYHLWCDGSGSFLVVDARVQLMYRGAPNYTVYTIGTTSVEEERTKKCLNALKV